MNKLNHFRTLAARHFAAALLLASTGSALADVHYVDVNSTNATPPYTNWSTAATNIQDAVDAAVAGDEIVVTNGIYATGGRATSIHEMNRVVVDKPLSLRSVNGPESTVIYGGYSANYVRCVFLTNTASLSGFTLTNGIVAMAGFSAGGAGAYGGTLNNCILTGNRAEFFGGGAAACTLNNCTLTGNSAFNGGGAYACTLNNCTLTGNSAGAAACTLNNCIVLDGSGNSSLNHCWTNAPLFVDTNGWANLRLQSNSPCINAGWNAFAPAGLDLDGNPRIVGGTVDIGAYEFQSLSLISFGVVSNRFGFNITGQSNWVIVLEASSDFTNWIPLATNTLSGSPFPFHDPTPPNLAQRFYRARLQ